jgi:hypothetical protein
LSTINFGGLPPFFPGAMRLFKLALMTKRARNKRPPRKKATNMIAPTVALYSSVYLLKIHHGINMAIIAMTKKRIF